MVKAMAVEYAKRNIRFNCISSGWVNTEMTEKVVSSIGLDAYHSIKSRHCLGIREKEYISNGIIFLLSDASKWITGTNSVIDGGYSCH